MNADRLRFKWDPHANGGPPVETKTRTSTDKIKSLEEYFEFIEQFASSGDENVFDQHVDSKFTLK